ncbi:MAG: hypothetical protein DRQ24_11270 [Candidatus Latescibacterota bacterium]|nr:MAG: hypothetical protein DRQ24_11270 [Candidatus Latescibacterota bacterium]
MARMITGPSSGVTITAVVIKRYGCCAERAVHTAASIPRSMVLPRCGTAIWRDSGPTGISPW